MISPICVRRVRAAFVICGLAAVSLVADGLFCSARVDIPSAAAQSSDRARDSAALLRTPAFEGLRADLSKAIKEAQDATQSIDN